MSKAKSSKSPKRSQRTKILQDDEIDEIMENITLKRPRNAYTQFCMEEVEKFKSKNKKTRKKKSTSKNSQENALQNGKNSATKKKPNTTRDSSKKKTNTDKTLKQ